MSHSSFLIVQYVNSYLKPFPIFVNCFLFGTGVPENKFAISLARIVFNDAWYKNTQFNNGMHIATVNDAQKPDPSPIMSMEASQGVDWISYK